MASTNNTVKMSRSAIRCSCCGRPAKGTPENQGYSDCCGKVLTVPGDMDYMDAFRTRKAELEAAGKQVLVVR